MSDFLRLTGQNGNAIRVAYDVIDVIVGYSNAVNGEGTGLEFVSGSLLHLRNGTSIWVVETPDVVEAHIDSYEVDLDDNTEEEGWSFA